VPTFALARVSFGEVGGRTTTSLTESEFAAATQLHPDLVRRFVALGLLDAARDAAGELRFPPSELAAAARLARLRAGFSLNYAALGLVAFLLDRIAELEQKGRQSWTLND
jgi:hypothetical protein